MRFAQPFLFLFSTLFFVNCQTAPNKNPRDPDAAQKFSDSGCCSILPKQKPTQVRIDYHHGLGGLPKPSLVSSYDIHLIAQGEGGSSQLEIQHARNTTMIPFSVTKEELSAPYQKLLEIGFDQIQVIPQSVVMYDAGAQRLEVRWQDENEQSRMAEKTRSGNLSIKDKRFDSLISAIEALVKEKIEQTALHQIEVKREPTQLIDPLWEIRLNPETPLEQREKLSTLNSFRLPAGQNLVHFLIRQDGAKDKFSSQTIEIEKGTSCLQIKMEEEQPKLSPCS